MKTSTPYLFREEEKPKFNINYSGIIALLLLALLIFLGGHEDEVFQVSAAELQRLEELREQQEREMVFRFTDEPEDDVEEQDTRFLSDANRIKKSLQPEETPDIDPDPFSKGDTYELKNTPKSNPTNTPQPRIVQPQVAEVPQTPPPSEEEQSQDEPQKEVEEALPDEPEEDVAEETQEEFEETTEEVFDKVEEKPEEAQGVAPIDPYAPKPYRKVTKQELAIARQKALQEINLLEQTAAAPPASGGAFDNPVGTRGPQVGVTVETNRSDLGDYLKILKQLIKGNWRIPNIARYEVAGVTGITFKIHQDGRISDVRVSHTSSHEPLDVAALNAINNTDPAPKLPEHVEDPWIPIKFGFYYNVRPRY